MSSGTIAAISSTENSNNTYQSFARSSRSRPIVFTAKHQKRTGNASPQSLWVVGAAAVQLRSRQMLTTKRSPRIGITITTSGTQRMHPARDAHMDRTYVEWILVTGSAKMVSFALTASYVEAFRTEAGYSQGQTVLESVASPSWPSMQASSISSNFCRLNGSTMGNSQSCREMTWIRLPESHGRGHYSVFRIIKIHRSASSIFPGL